MKILRITVSNIASLSGTQTIDFTVEPLRSAGLFSISGATGAGKSTLLDALCLALYDRTPRLHRVGRLESLDGGEQQNDPRTLLR
ncbi:MAG: AAA family ATPase, partial [Planctomycetaceae bacterium]|nr:AAA family ATPase [Planctomycetaceae bacterium]